MLPPKPSDCWRAERPWLKLLREPSALPGPCLHDDDDAQLFQWWFDHASHTFVLDQSSNPLSLPILEHLAISPALGFALQSISAGHRSGFARDSQVACLEKRNTAAFLQQFVVFFQVVSVLLALVVAQTWLQEMLKPKKPAFCSLSPVQIAGQLLALGDSIDICCNMLVSWMKSPALGCLCPEYHAGDIVLDTSAFCSLNSV